MRLRKTTILFLLLAGAACLLAAYALAREQAQLGGKLIRLHVVANSDTAADQSQKIAVRDRLLAVLAEQNWQSREDAAAWLRENLDVLEAAGGAALPDGEILRVTLDEEWFPTREYDTFSLPAGKYLSLRAEIGAGEGHNWWCVVYPTLCAVPEASVPETAAAGGLTAREIALITQDTPAVTVRFGLYEWIADFFQDT